MKLHTLVSCLHDFPVVPKENPEITSIEADSRKVKEGSLFVCMKGYTVDSHDFAKQAAAQERLLLLRERPIDVDVPVVLVKNTFRSLAVLAGLFLWSTNTQVTFNRYYRYKWKDNNIAYYG